MAIRILKLLTEVIMVGAHEHRLARSHTHRARRDAVKSLLAIALLTQIGAMPSAGRAQVAERTLRVGILSSGSLDVREPLDAALVQGLREKGYIEGKNLFIERRYSSAKVRDNANELAGMKLDAILTTCSPSTRLMKEATSSTPIVMAAVSDPVGQGIIASLAKPGRNITGMSSQAEDLLAKRLELVTEFVPGSTTIAVLVNANNPVHVLGWKRLASAAQEKNLRLLKVDVRAGEDPAGAIEAAVRAGAAALFVLPDDPLMLNIRRQIVDIATTHRLPDFHWASEFVVSGGLMSYGENLRSSYRAAAAYMDKIKKGANPAELPVEQPTRFELVVNMKRAKSLGLNVPQSLLVRADEVIQ